jgi:hypothetical protein
MAEMKTLEELLTVAAVLALIEHDERFLGEVWPR